MLTLHLAKGSSALAAHILLEEVGATYETVELSIPKNEHLTPEFLRLNPKARVPVLETPDGILTENAAILEYIAATHPKADVLVKGAFAQANARALCAYLGNTAHVAFAHKLRGARWANEAASMKDMQTVVPRNIAECADYLENALALCPWAMGTVYTFCDPYLFLMGQWMAKADVSFAEYPKLAAHQSAMRNRPATQAALTAHGLA